MDILEAIFTRRSIRRFTGEPVGEDHLKLLMKAGFSAPSAHNFQPRNFVVVRDKNILEAIAEAHPYAKMLPQAGCGIIVCGDKKKQGSTSFILEDCSASIENMLLAAHGIGLGAVWCALYPVKQVIKTVTKFLNLPSNIIPVGMVVVGHKNEEKAPADRYDESKIHYEQWKA